MKKAFTKLLSLFIAVAFVVSCVIIPASAITWDEVEAEKYASRYYSSYYTYGKFYKNMTSIPLTGDGARDVVAVAVSQAGYLEGDSSSGQSGEDGGSSNMTEYGAYTGVNGAAWCASFCSWCMYTAEVTDTRGTETYMARNGYYWSECYVPYWSNFLYDNGRYKFSDYYRSSYSSSQASYKPQPGDLIFFVAGYSPLDEGHIGLVVYSDNSYVYTIEGNTSSQDGVEAEGGGAFFKKYALSSSSIAGYGILPYKTVDDLPELDYSGENPTNGLYVTTSGAKSVYFKIEDSDASWTLPMSSVFEVTDIDYDPNGVLMLYSKCEINGETVYGWIPHGTANNGYTRTLQIYASPEAEFSSDVYEITSDNKIKGLSVGTTVNALINNVTSDYTVKLFKDETELALNAKLGTGMVLKTMDGNTVVDTYTIVVKGDVNGDAKISGLDYIRIKRHILSTNKLAGAYFDAASIVKSGKVSAYDYLMIKRYVLGTARF